MDRLTAQLQRLYSLPDPLAPDDAATGPTRAMAVGFAKPSQWETVASFYQGVQEDFELPAPAISVSGKAGFTVWFSLAEPVSALEARRFLEILRLKYLAEIPVSQLQFRPGEGRVEPAPALHPETGKWSTFIDPAMGSMFADEGGLEMAPNLERQADLLAGFDSIRVADFRRVLDLPGAPAEPAAVGLDGHFSDPRSFLLAVMNDPSVGTASRIEAAKALLPYFEKSGSR